MGTEQILEVQGYKGLQQVIKFIFLSWERTLSKCISINFSELFKISERERKKKRPLLHRAKCWIYLIKTQKWEFFFFIIWRIDFGGIFSFPTMFSFLVGIFCILQSSVTWLNHRKLYRPWKPQLRELAYSRCGAVSPCWLYTAHLTQKPEGRALPHVALCSARASQVTYAESGGCEYPWCLKACLQRGSTGSQNQQESQTLAFTSNRF